MRPLRKQLDDEMARINKDYEVRLNNLNNLEKYAVDVDASVEDNPLVYSTSVSYDEINIYTSPKAFLSFEEPALMELLESLEMLTGEDCVSQEYPDGNFITYTCGKIKVFATPRDDATCQRVITGVKKEIQSRYVDVEVEVPVYKFKC